MGQDKNIYRNCAFGCRRVHPVQAMGRRWRSGVCFLCFWDACHLSCGRRKCFAGASVGFLANAAVLCAAVYEAEQQACGLSGLRAAAARGFCEIWCLCVCLCVIFFFFLVFPSSTGTDRIARIYQSQKNLFHPYHTRGWLAHYLISLFVFFL